MRYFDFSIAATADQLAERAKVDLRDLDYDSPVGSVNQYMYRHLVNGVVFMAYREETSSVRAVFAFDERKSCYETAREHVAGILADVFGSSFTREEPAEITMKQFFDIGSEARRRGIGARFPYINRDWFMEFFGYFYDERNSVRFGFDEMIIPDEAPQVHDIYDGSFKKELCNIASHAGTVAGTANVVHYFLSVRGEKAARELVRVLGYSLLKAGRISGRRISVISNIDPEFYKHNNYLENVIANNSGGMVVIDLHNRFDTRSSEYVMAARRIVDLFRQYSGRCLFVFTYDINDTGFSYMVLPEIKKYAIPVLLREGSGDRGAAVSYLEQLIGGTAQASCASQAGEFMQSMPGNSFTQTAMYDALDRFEPWCINKNMLKAYDMDGGGDFMLDRDADAVSAYERLQKLIGLGSVKRQIDEVIASNLVARERKRRCGDACTLGNMHMVFGGNPGSAKTTVAELFAKIGKEKGLLKSGAFVRRGGMDLNGGCDAVRDAFTEASGGVLFIDEAYALATFTGVTTLIQEMETHRDDVIVILAGYNDDMKRFLNLNDGLASRIPNWIEFPDYTADELSEIFDYIVDSRGFTASDEARKEAHYIFEKARMVKNFGNGRYVRNLVERAIRRQSTRLFESAGSVENIGREELFLLTKEDVLAAEDGEAAKDREPGAAMRRLENMIGLASVKEVVRKAMAFFIMNKRCSERGIKREKTSMHMVFTGNPGTAKTTVARLFAQILRDAKVLPRGQFVETGRSGLVGPFVGSTALIVKQKFAEAKGGVLFIDEAYSLCDGTRNSFGDEAINTIVQEMENNREDTVVIFAGYPGPMDEFLARNPGMQSRVSFRIDFEDYTTDELVEITKLMAEDRGLRVSDAAMAKLRRNYDAVRSRPDFGNGRFVRNMLEQAEMNLAERLLRTDEDGTADELISNIEEEDIPAVQPDPAEKETKRNVIGFTTTPLQ